MLSLKVIDLNLSIESFLCFACGCIVTHTMCLRAGVCRPCVETELTASKKSATDGN